MELMKFEGWVEKVLAGNEYQQEIIVRDYESIDTKGKFSNEITFTASVKRGAAEQLKDVRPDDKVRIQFFVTGRCGISKSSGKEYHINNLVIAKKDGVVILQRANVDDGIADPDIDENGDVSELPF